MAAPVSQIKRYGRLWPVGWQELDIELYCYRTNRTPEQGGLGNVQHFMRVVTALWGPHNKVKKFAWHPWAMEMLEAACENRYVGLAGCASSGKTDWAAIWALVNFLADPRNTTVIVMSTTLKEARKRIWKSVREYFTAVPGMPAELLDSLGLIRFFDGVKKGSDTQGISLMAGEKTAIREAYNKLIGIKNARVFLIVDEMTGVGEQVLDAATANLEANDGQGSVDPDGTRRIFHMVGMGNTSSYYDCFGLFIQPVDGWASIHVDSGTWKTIYGICLHFDGEKSPNVLAGKKLFPWMIDLDKVEYYRRILGENTVRYWRMVRGFFSPTGSEQAVFSEPDIHRFKGDQGVVWEGTPTPVAALDPSFTNGGDDTILYFGLWGRSDQGIDTLLLTEFFELREDVTDEENPRNFQIARMVREKCQARGVSPEHFAMDATGAGDPLADIVNREWSRKILRVKFGGAPTARPVSTENPELAHDAYANRVTEIWYSGVEFLHNGQLRGIKPELAREMTQRNLTTKRSAGVKICIESKKEMKERVGKSPDKTDAAMLLVDLVRERFHARTGRKPAERSKSWRKLATLADRVYSEGLRAA